VKGTGETFLELFCPPTLLDVAKNQEMDLVRIKGGKKSTRRSGKENVLF